MNMKWWKAAGIRSLKTFCQTAIMYYGKRKLIKKEEFEDYLRRRPGMREELKRGSPVNNRWGHRSAETRSTTEQTKPTVEAGTAVEGGEMNVIS